MSFTYATVADYQASAEAGGQDALDLSDLDQVNGDTLNSTQIQEALEQGVGEMEPLLAVRYPVASLRAIDPPLQTLVDINITIARYVLDVRYGARGDTRKRYEDAMKRLQRIADGKEALIDSQGQPLTFDDTVAMPRGGKVGKGEPAFTSRGVYGLMGY